MKTINNSLTSSREEMETSCLPVLRVIDSFQVSPAPGSVLDETSIPFTFFDLRWIFPQPTTVERIFFYTFPHLASYFLSKHLPALRSSLSVALRELYPLAGNFRRTPGTDDRFELYYKEGDSVTFTVVEVEGGFDVLSSSRARSSALLQQLVPPLPHCNELQALLAVQVTVFPQQGIALGITVNHSACDGTSSTQFVHLWAAACRPEEKVLSAHVIIDRNLIHDPSNLYSVHYDKLVKHQLSNPGGEHKISAHNDSSTSTTVLSSFTLKQEHILKLKKMVSEKAQQLKKSFHCSTLVVAFAYTWVCHVRAQCVDPDKKSCFLFAADFRARMQPPLPATYFGNCIWTCIAEADPTDLMSNDGVVVAAEAIGKAVNGLSISLKSLEHYVNLFSSLDKISLIPSVRSPKFGVYDVDFGWGKPAKVEVASIARTGAVSVADSREERGGVEIGIALPKSKMDCF